jgi:hypothetical protein
MVFSSVNFISTVDSPIQTPAVISDKKNNETNGKSPTTDTPQNSASPQFKWWSEKHEYRVRVDVSPNAGVHTNAPIEFFINFTQILWDNDIMIHNPGASQERVNVKDILLVEQTTSGAGTVYPVQYDSRGTAYDQGDIAWIINKNFDTSTLTFFIYIILGNTDAKGDAVVQSSTSRSRTYFPFRLFYEHFDYLNSQNADSTLGLYNIAGQSGASGNTQVINYFNNVIAGRNGIGAYTQVGNVWRGQTLTNPISCAQHAVLTLTFSNYVYDTVYDSQYTNYDIIAVDLQDSSIAGPPVSSTTRRGLLTYGRQGWTGIPGGFVGRRSLPNVWQYHQWNLKVDVPQGTTPYTNQILTRVIYELDDDNDVGYVLPRYYQNYPVSWDDVSIWNTTVQQNRYIKPIHSVVDFDAISSNFNLQILDLDGFPVPNAQIYIRNNGQPSLNQQGVTGPEGTLAFGSVSINQKYNVTVNYTVPGISPSQTFTIGYQQNVELDTFNFNLTINTILWSMDFRVKDYDGLPVSKGFVVLYNNSPGQEPIANGSLNSNGEVTLRYINSSLSFNYSVYYNTKLLPSNYKYQQTSFKIANGTISRDYIDKPKLVIHPQIISPAGSTFLTGGSYPGNNSFVSNTQIYINMSAPAFENKKFGYVQIKLTDFTSNILNYNIQGVLSDDTEPTLATGSGTLGSSLTIELDGYEMKGLLLFLQKDGTGTNWKLNLSYYLRPTENIVANITTVKLDLSTLIENPTWGEPLVTSPQSGFICQFINQSNSESIANITSVEGQTVDFTYLRVSPSSYNNITLRILFASQNQYINTTEFPMGSKNDVNWTQALNFEMDTATSRDVLIYYFDVSYETMFNITSSFSFNRIWGELVLLGANFTYREGTDPFTLIDADSISFAVRDLEYDLFLTGTMTRDSLGIYSLNIDTSLLRGGKTYTVTFQTVKAGYPAPKAMPDPITIVLAKRSTTFAVFDQSTGDQINNNQQLEKKWGQVFNLTVIYQYETIYLEDAYVGVEWQYQSMRQMYEQSGSGGIVNYTISINTTEASSLGTYFVNILLDLQNYDGKSMFFQLQIMPIPTTLNSTLLDTTTDLLRINLVLNQTDAYLFNFTYRDSFNFVDLANATTEYTFDYITGSQSGLGTLDLLDNGYAYQLNFTTEDRDVGNYILLVTIRKTNYEQRQALIFLTIQKRNIDYQLEGDFNGLQIAKVKGDDWLISVKLRDMSRGYIPLTGAVVTLNFNTAGHTFNLVYTTNGVYSTTATWNSLKTKFTQENYQGQLTILKDTFNTISLGITLLISDRGMQITYAGDFDGKTEVSKVKGNDFVFEIKLIDTKTGAIIENAQPKLVIASKNMEIPLIYVGDGVYRATESFENIEAFIRDDSFQAILVIELENYATIRESITITIKMEEVAEGVPLFYLLIVIGAAVLLLGTIGGYKAIQQARIPAYVKLIDKTSKVISSKKEIGLERIAMSDRQEMVAMFGDRWKLLGLDLAQIIGAGKEKAITGENLAPGDEEGGE